MGSVYKVSDGERDYYGSTTTTLYQRLCVHKCPTNTTTTTILNRDNLTIILMEEVEDESQLLIREQYYLDNYECVNTQRAHTTPEYHKQYNKQYQKQYQETNRDKLNEYYKQYEQKNINKLKEYRKQYQETNRDKIKERNTTRYTCVCGAVLTKSHKAQRERTQKHINKIG